jgi:hypothetical protein
MTEQFILQYIPQRVKQLGYTNYHVRYRDMVLEGNTSLTIAAYNELYFIVDDPPGLTVDSNYGLYDSTDEPIEESVHQHRGEITITNPGADRRRIKFIQLIIVN